MTEEKAPIEEYFPIEQVNKIADKESKAKRYYRPVYTMHKWWARRLGCVFRSMLLYTLADDDMKILEASSKDGKNKRLDGNFSEHQEDKLVPADWDGNPETLWDDFYLQDVSFEDKTVLDPFMGGGTTIVEALRMNANVVGKDLNPVAWFTVKKETDPVDLEKLDDAFEKLKEEIAPEIKKYYKTKCPECEDTADAMYYFWVKELDCRNCGSTTPLFKDYRVAKTRSLSVEHKHKAICENCGEPYKPGEDCPHCGEEFQHKHYYHVYCPACNEIFETAHSKEENTCPHCGNGFNPKDGHVSGKYFTCEDCGQKNEVIETISEKGKPSERLWAVEYHCSSCEMKGYKASDERDDKLLQEAVAEYNERQDNLPIPEQKIPEGKETTPRLPNWGYGKFREMFNERQLLNLGKLVEEISAIEEKNIREYLLLAVSDSLDYNNMFCGYNTSKNHMGHLFERHAFAPLTTPVEANTWGLDYGMGGFSSYFENMREACKYKKSPFEKHRENGETKQKPMKIPIESDSPNLGAGDSSYLEVEDKSVDAVITDPPYFDNVMYSELSNFYYVWLREILSEEYDEFTAEYVSTTGEAIKNNSQDKDKEDYTQLLRDIFSESRRKLKDDGLMAFTFHHGETDAWSAVLGSVLESGYLISSIYPIQAEMSQSMHIRDQGNIEYDMIIVCRKRDVEPEEGIWSEMEDRIYLEAKQEVEKLRTEDRELTQGDMFVITIGKCLEIYSKHYPEVYRDGEKVSVSDALESIQEIIDGQIMGGMFDEIATELDLISATYISYIAGRGQNIGYSSLNKNLQQRSVDISDLTDSGIVRKDGSKLVIPSLDERAEEIESKSQESLTSVDRAHYLAYLKEQDKLASHMHEWASEGSIRALRKLGDIENNNEFVELADYMEEKMKDTRLT
mgnify:CR=1 FL=1